MSQSAETPHLVRHGSLSRWAVAVVLLAVLGLAAFGAASISRGVDEAKAEARSATVKAEEALSRRADERTDIEVMKNEMKHISAAVDGLTGMVEILLARDRPAQPRD